MELKFKGTPHKIYSKRQNSHEKVLQLKSCEETFTVSHTQRTTKIKVYSQNLEYFYGGGDYSNKEFQQQRKLKTYIKKNIVVNKTELPVYTQADINYYSYSKTLIDMPYGDIISNVVEYDINKAYYQCAYNLGYINAKMYSEYINMPKHIRLRFIGVIATRKRTYTYIQGKLSKNNQIKEDEELRNVWFHICKQVDNALERFKEITKDNFLFYYVDGIYLKSGDYSNELKIIKDEFEFDFSEEKVNSIKKIWRDEKDKSLKATQYEVEKYDKKTDTFKKKPFTIKNNTSSECNFYKNILNENGLN